MELTSAAAWLNTAFAAFDQNILAALNGISCGFLTALTKAITFLGERGILFLVIAIILFLFTKTRRTGFCMGFAICLATLITSFFLKDLIARPRPFETTQMFLDFWRAVGSATEEGFSFPSGHVTGAAAAMLGLTFIRGKRWILPSILIILLMAFSRCYLICHYPTDVIAGILVGLVSALISLLVTKILFGILERNKRRSFVCYTILTLGFGRKTR